MDVQPLQVRPVAVILHGHLMQHAPISRHYVHIVLAHNPHALVKVAGFCRLGCCGQVGGGGRRMLEAALGDCALGEELARNAAASATASGVKR